MAMNKRERKRSRLNSQSKYNNKVVKKTLNFNPERQDDLQLLNIIDGYAKKQGVNFTTLCKRAIVAFAKTDPNHSFTPTAKGADYDKPNPNPNNE